MRLALHSFQHLLLGHHVLIRSDNTAAIAYLNRQGGVRSKSLNSLAVQIHLWAYPRFLSLSAAHVPGFLNFGADLLSRGTLRNSEWYLHPEVVSQIWSRFGRARVDLFASRHANHCPLWFSLHQDAPPLGHDAFAHLWPRQSPSP